MRGAGGAAVPSAAQATKLNQQVRRPRSPRGFGRHPPPPPSCWALPPLCLMSISVHFKSNLEPQREENLWENSQLSSVDAIESHPGCLFWVPLRKAAWWGGLPALCGPRGPGHQVPPIGPMHRALRFPVCVIKSSRSGTGRDKDDGRVLCAVSANPETKKSRCSVATHQQGCEKDPSGTRIVGVKDTRCC